MELYVTAGLLLLEIAILARCYLVQKRPIDPMRPRIIPYGGLMGVVMVLMLATLAHLIGLVTGNPVVPRGSRLQ